MRKSEFGLKILNGIELPSGLVVMEDDATYSLRLINYHDALKCDAVVKIDGELIGRYRIEPFSIIQIKRPAKEDKSFIFRKINDIDSLKFIDKRKKESLGFVEVEFIPEKLVIPCLSLDLFKCGYTDYGKESGQKFVPAESIDPDESKSIIIKARLVSVDSSR